MWILLFLKLHPCVLNCELYGALKDLFAALFVLDEQILIQTLIDTNIIIAILWVYNEENRERGREQKQYNIDAVWNEQLMQATKDYVFISSQKDNK